jgi:hypothetical protein
MSEHLKEVRTDMLIGLVTDIHDDIERLGSALDRHWRQLMGRSEKCDRSSKLPR